MRIYSAKQLFFLSLRYLFLLITGLFFLDLIYTIFTPLTLYPVYFFLNLFYPAQLLPQSTILINTLTIYLIPACISGSAYFLLLILNFSTPMHVIKRITSISFLITSFLILNIIRIILFSILSLNSFSYFDEVHRAAWYFGSTILLAILWFAHINLFKITSIPVYTDFKTLLLVIKRRK